MQLRCNFVKTNIDMCSQELSQRFKHILHPNITQMIMEKHGVNYTINRSSNQSIRILCWVAGVSNYTTIINIG